MSKPVQKMTNFRHLVPKYRPGYSEMGRNFHFLNSDGFHSERLGVGETLAPKSRT